MPTYPILLAHGVARFDFLRNHFVNGLGLPADRLSDHGHYFRNIRSYLSKNGFPNVHHTNVEFAGGADRRAADLKIEVERVLAASKPPQTKVHIIGHSMGGLDARRMIVDLGMAEHVCSLTTIGTPHKGSSFADWGAEHRGEEVVRKLHEVIDLDGFLDLKTAACAEFNARAEAAEADNGVFYQTYSCWEEDSKRVFGPLQLSWKEIKKREEGHNDGLVAVTSQRWTASLQGTRPEPKEVPQKSFPVLGDHLNEVGWWDVRQLSGKLRLSALRNPIAFFKSLFNDRGEYENQIKATYLSIAKDLESRFPV
jgi:triacylglycerol lipase